MYTVLVRTARRIRRIGRFFLGSDLLQSRQMSVPFERHGTWSVASNMLNKHSVVYSIGVGNEISFDLSLIDHYGLTVHAFDPTPRSVAWIQKQILPRQFNFHPVGVADFDGVARFRPPPNPDYVSYSLIGGSKDSITSVDAPVRRLGSLMADLGHSEIDLLKIDIEGAEYGVIEDALGECIPANQILVEFHHRFPYIGVEKTRSAIRSLNEAGYRIFFVSDIGEEYSFLRAPRERF